MNFEIGVPEKSAYKFNEVTSMTSVKPYVLRFWETEFEGINPKCLEDGSKTYTQKDIEAIEKIKDLLFNQKLSIPEAKLILDKKPDQVISSQSESIKTFTPENITAKNIGSNTKEPMNLEEKSQDLKFALEQIIESHSMPIKMPIKNLETTEPKEFHDKAKSVTQMARETSLCDKDILNLVSAKKKLTAILGKIDTISEARGW